MIKRIVESRWPISLAIVVVVIAVSVIVILMGNRAPAGRISLETVSDGSGGTIVAWQDKQGIHAQRINSEGNPLWTHEVLAGAKMLPEAFSLASDGQGGAIITWEDRSSVPDDYDFKNPAYFNPIPVYSQRLNAVGEPLWGKGVPTGITERLGVYPVRLVPDDAGGAFLAWNDFKTVYRALHDDYFYLQKIGPQGNPMWGEKGILVCSSPPYHPTTPEEQARGETGTWTRSFPVCRSFEVVSDGAGGVIVILTEETGPRYSNVYAQRFNTNGQPVWQQGGVRIYTGWEGEMPLVASDGNGGAFIVSVTRRESLSGYDPGLNTISAQRLSAEGKLLWPGSGVLIEELPYLLGQPLVVARSPGSAIILWTENVYGGPESRFSLHAVKVGADGAVMWQTDSVFVAEKGQFISDLGVCDGKDAVILTWRVADWNNPQWTGKVYAQKLSDQGKIIEAGERSLVFAGLDFKYQDKPRIVPDGSGGAVIFAIVGQSPLYGDRIQYQRWGNDTGDSWGGSISIRR